VAHGWIPGWGGLTRLRRILGEALSKELVLLGDVWDSQKAASAGLANWVVAEDELENRLAEMCSRLIELDPRAVELAKAALSDSMRTSVGADVLYEALATQQARGRQQ
jgi:enoyl-CoA hydratase/carnithine racemase